MGGGLLETRQLGVSSTLALAVDGNDGKVLAPEAIKELLRSRGSRLATVATFATGLTGSRARWRAG